MLRPRVLTCIALVLLWTSGCSGLGQAPAAGYAAQVMLETDAAARELLPAAAAELDVQVHVGLAGFVECDLTGWRYRAEGDLVGAPDPATAVATLRGLLQNADLEVEVRDDGSLVGRRGALSVLVDGPAGPTQIGTTLRHYSFTHACTPYSDADAEVARTAPETDYTEFLPPQSLYNP